MTLHEFMDYINIDDNQPYAIKEYNYDNDEARIVYDSLEWNEDSTYKDKEIETMYTERINGITYIIFEYMTMGEV